MFVIKPHAPAGATGGCVGGDTTASMKAEEVAPAGEVPVPRRFASTSGREGVRFARSRRLFGGDGPDDASVNAAR